MEGKDGGGGKKHQRKNLSAGVKFIPFSEDTLLVRKTLILRDYIFYRVLIQKAEMV